MNTELCELRDAVSQLGQTVTVYDGEKQKILADATARQLLVEEEKRNSEGMISAAIDRLSMEYMTVKTHRTALLTKILNYVRDKLNSITDKHWIRMREKYYAKARQLADKGYEEKPYTELADELEKFLLAFDRDFSRLENAFIGPEMSGAIGYVFHSYRKKTYASLAELREKILRCCHAIDSLPDINEKQAYAEAVRDERMRAVNARARASMEQIPVETENALCRIDRLMVQALEKCLSDKLFEEKSIQLGKLEIDSRITRIIRNLPDKFSGYVDGAGLKMPLSISQLHENVLLTCSDSSAVPITFTSVAMDILKSEPGAHIFVSDIKGIGSNYGFLTRPQEKGRVTVWRREEELINGLNEVSCLIASTYSDVLGDTYWSLDDYNRDDPKRRMPHSYILIDDINANVTQRVSDMLCRIIENGERAGVHLLTAVKNGVPLERHVQPVLRQMEGKALSFPVIKNKVIVAEGVRVCLPDALTQQQIDAACNSIDSHLTAKAVIPLGPNLPDARNWQGKSSADGISVGIGRDSQGKEKNLILSEDKPYAMIIGDVDTGKSSLLHTIMIQLLANYAPSEVKMAIGDFKDGAEFNIYAASKLPGVEAVVDNEDPDVMASFLQYYIREMHYRQKCFEQLETYTSHLIRKYETYRQYQHEATVSFPDLPRIVIIIDEFQSLFENVHGTAELLNELVRKGRTYGIHIIMASQRASSDNTRNTFTGELKNYFTSRFVFKTPQAAARTMLSERCADTGRENSGIARASLLSKGHAIYNTYMGQSERDNCEVQCYYAGDNLICDLCDVIKRMNGEGDSILLRNSDVSLSMASGNQNEIELGMSPCLRKDFGMMGADDITDDIVVSLSVPPAGRNIICTGADNRVALSVVKSAIRCARAAGNHEVHIFGKAGNSLTGMLKRAVSEARFHNDIESIREELGRQAEGTARYINVFVEISDFNELSQSAGGLRLSRESELLRQVLNGDTERGNINIVHSRSFRNIRSGFQHVLASTPVYVLAVGDSENIRAAVGERYRLGNSEFDVTNNDAIKAYYYNRNTEKTGKVILFR